jgi:hypothetical protein
MMWGRSSLLGVLVVAGSMLALGGAAQAAPHWYKNNSRLEEASKLPYISWGFLGVFDSQCRFAVAGHIENPAGGGTGVGAIEAVDTYECNNETCEMAGGKIGLVFEDENEPGTAVQLAWPTELTEAVKGTIRLNGRDIRFLFRCQFGHEAAREEEVSEGEHKGDIRRSASEYNAPGATICTTEPGYGLEPKIENGSSPGLPSKISFGDGSGELRCGGSFGNARFEGKLKLMGYNESELLTTKNP